MYAVEDTKSLLSMRGAKMMKPTEFQDLLVGGRMLASWWRKHQDFPAYFRQFYNYAQRWMNTVWELVNEWRRGKMQHILQDKWDVLIAWFLRVREANDREISGERSPSYE